MLLDTILEPITDLSSLAGQAAAQYIADHSSLSRDGWVITGIRFLVATLAFLVIGVGGAVLLIALVWWIGWKLLLASLFS